MKTIMKSFKNLRQRIRPQVCFTFTVQTPQSHVWSLKWKVHGKNTVVCFATKKNTVVCFF